MKEKMLLIPNNMLVPSDLISKISGEKTDQNFSENGETAFNLEDWIKFYNENGCSITLTEILGVELTYKIFDTLRDPFYSNDKGKICWQFARNIRSAYDIALNVSRPWLIASYTDKNNDNEIVKNVIYDDKHQPLFVIDFSQNKWYAVNPYTLSPTSKEYPLENCPWIWRSIRADFNKKPAGNKQYQCVTIKDIFQRYLESILAFLILILEVIFVILTPKNSENHSKQPELKCLPNEENKKWDTIYNRPEFRKNSNENISTPSSQTTVNEQISREVRKNISNHKEENNANSEEFDEKIREQSYQ